MDYMPKRWLAFTRFLDRGRVCLSNNTAERGLRGITLGRKSRLFAGSDRCGIRAAAMYSLIVTTKMNGIAPILTRRRAGPHRRAPASKLDELLPWNWRPTSAAVSKAA